MSSMSLGFNALAQPSSPLAEYRAQLQQGFLTRPIETPPQGRTPPTPPGSRGSFTLVDSEDLRIEVDLGPILVNHIFRGTSRALQVSVFA
jgi:hypothetical protein